jgi:hypothetical protein
MASRTTWSLATSAGAGERRTSPTATAGDQAVPSITAEEPLAARAGGEALQVIDAPALPRESLRQYMMADAVYRDPERVHEWMSELSNETPVVRRLLFVRLQCCCAVTLRKRGSMRGTSAEDFPRGTLRAAPEDRGVRCSLQVRQPSGSRS